MTILITIIKANSIKVIYIAVSHAIFFPHLSKNRQNHFYQISMFIQMLSWHKKTCHWWKYSWVPLFIVAQNISRLILFICLLFKTVRIDFPLLWKWRSVLSKNAEMEPSFSTSIVKGKVMFWAIYYFDLNDIFVWTELNNFP